MEWTIYAYAVACAAGIATACLFALLNDAHVAPALADESLRPATPQKDRPDNRIGAARTVLEAWFADLRTRHNEADLVKMMPVMVAEAYLPQWMSNTIPLDDPVDSWLVHYTGGASATAVAPDGARLLLDARTKPERPSGDTMLALVRVGGEGHIIHVRAKRHPAQSHYRTVGFGRFRRHVPTTRFDPDHRTIYSNYLSMQGA